MAAKKVSVKFFSSEVDAVRFQVLRYRRPKAAATTAGEHEQASRVKEASKLRVVETVEGTWDAASGSWVGTVNTLKQSEKAKFFKSLLRAEGFAVTRDATGREIGRRSVTIISAPPIKTKLP